jgi:signal recognition particle subunit SRP68
VYQLLSRRIQRDLLLMGTLLASSNVERSKSSFSKSPLTRGKPDVDSRLNPAIVKLLDTVLQSLMQMRTLSIVDDSPDLASAIDARLSITNSRRCVYLARCYAAVKKYAEALTLLQRATIYIRETNSSLSLSESDLINGGTPRFFSLVNDDIKEIESAVKSDSVQYKRDWFAYNGGSVDAEPSTYEKPLFFNIALNYVKLDTDHLYKRAGKELSTTTPGQMKTEQQPEKKMVPKAKVEEHVSEPVPAPVSQHSTSVTGGLSSLLGGWWSKSS